MYSFDGLSTVSSSMSSWKAAMSAVPWTSSRVHRRHRLQDAYKARVGVASWGEYVGNARREVASRLRGPVVRA